MLWTIPRQESHSFYKKNLMFILANALKEFDSAVCKTLKIYLVLWSTPMAIFVKQIFLTSLARWISVQNNLWRNLKHMKRSNDILYPFKESVPILLNPHLVVKPREGEIEKVTLSKKPLRTGIPQNSFAQAFLNTTWR